MKHLSKNFWLFFIAVFVALAIISMPVYLKAKEESGKKMGCPGMKMMHTEKHEHGKEGCCEGMEEMMKDVKVEVANLPDGVQVKITSDNPEVVKKIQEMHKEGKGMGCPMMMKHEEKKEVKKEEHKH